MIAAADDGDTAFLFHSVHKVSANDAVYFYVVVFSCSVGCLLSFG